VSKESSTPTKYKKSNKQGLNKNTKCKRRERKTKNNSCTSGEPPCKINKMGWLQHMHTPSPSHEERGTQINSQEQAREKTQK